LRKRTGFAASDDIINRIIRREFVPCTLSEKEKSDDRTQYSVCADWFDYSRVSHDGHGVIPATQGKQSVPRKVYI
jgi:hypothetical protein